ncbi:hypothetical protein [Thiopseudomonas denitrificans]|uniref:Uncharacterized protein n=1 Tax=Thiopseudomonas denitrificans TaxID=1501432 RepID=A0A4R6U2C9_9GAMM|nr:hypothetical protein [Thiopseudomonas denitrificans]TDQ39502.1 hypothetical protein DFQ45_102196 [Thiopseudomonas denitrificans]
MNNPLNIMTLLIIVSMIILVFGFTWRNKHWGPVVMLVGVLSMMSSIIYRIVLALSF